MDEKSAAENQQRTVPLLEFYYPGRNHNFHVQRLKCVRRFEVTLRKPIFKFHMVLGNLSRSICAQLWLLNKLLSDSKAPQKPRVCLREAVVHLTLCGNWNFVKKYSQGFLSQTSTIMLIYHRKPAYYVAVKHLPDAACVCLIACCAHGVTQTGRDWPQK